jgi:adenylate cyclase
MSETRKLAAILVADIVGYSRLAGVDEERTLSRLRGLRSDLIDPAIAAHRGRVVKRTGDGSLIEFRSVVDAVRCAIEVQNGLAERNAGVPPERRIEFRVGIHLGDVVEESDGDLMGDGVNVAARLEGICEPGAICLSEDAYRQVKGRLDLAVSDLGPKELKNIAEPIRVYSLEIGKPAQAKQLAAATSAEKPAEPKKRTGPAFFGAAIIALVVLTAAGGWHFLAAERSTPGASLALSESAPRLSIVVLRFANLSGDPVQDYLADAVTDQLTTALANQRDKVVVAHTSAVAYKGKPIDAKAIGRELGVRYLLEGAVQSTSNQVRVNAQLVDTANGTHLWADQFDTQRGDLLQTQDEIVVRLARAMYLQLPEIEAARLRRAGAANPNAEDLALQCQAVVLKNDIASVGTIPQCERARDADPGNVRALTWSAIEFLHSRGRGQEPEDDLWKADKLLSKAIAVDPKYAPAHLLKAFVLQAQFHLDEAIAEDRLALDLDPSLVDAYWHMGVVKLRQGEFEASLELLDKAIRLSPHDPMLPGWYADKAIALLALKDYDKAIEWARRSIDVRSKNAAAHLCLIVALALTGQEPQAHEALQRYHTVLPWSLATIAAWERIRPRWINDHTDPGGIELWDRYTEGLRKAGMPEE